MRFTEKDKQGRLIYCAVIIIQKYFGAIVGICLDNFTKGNFDCAAGAAYTRGDVATELTIEKVPANTWAYFLFAGKMSRHFKSCIQKFVSNFSRPVSISLQVECVY